MFRSIGLQELVIILVIVLLLFGPKQLPKLTKMFGKAMRDVKSGLEGKDEEESPKEIAEGQSDATAEEAKKPEDAAV